MQNGNLATPGGRITERPDVTKQFVVYREGEDVGLMAPFPEKSPDAASAVANRIAPMGSRDPLIDYHFIKETGGSRRPTQPLEVPEATSPILTSQSCTA